MVKLFVTELLTLGYISDALGITQKKLLPIVLEIYPRGLKRKQHFKLLLVHYK